MKIKNIVSVADYLETAKDKPLWMDKNSIHYEGINGSWAYGNATEKSDFDIYGFCIPPAEVIFPHLRGNIPGFDENDKKFEQYNLQNVLIKNKECDFSIYNIAKYFYLCSNCNPNMIDSLFIPEECIINTSEIGKLVISNKEIFLSKKAYHTFSGYASSQKNKILHKKNTKGKRTEIIEKFGWDTKFGSHLIRLLLECKEIFQEGTLTLNKNALEISKIREGFYTEKEILEWSDNLQKELDELYISSKKIPDRIRHQDIKNLLIKCLEDAYGSLDGIVSFTSK